MSYLAILLSLVVLARAAAAEAFGERVTLLQVLAQPERYQGKEIQVIGYLQLEFEGDCLYLHKEDCDHGIIGNDIWVDVTEEMQKQRSKLSDNYVIMAGTFDATAHGHMGLSSGTLTHITRCEVWDSRKQPRTVWFLLAGAGALVLLIVTALIRKGRHHTEPGASPNGGRAERLRNSTAGSGPPSVS